MTKRIVFITCFAVACMAALGFAAWLYRLPEASAHAAAEPPPTAETAEMLAGLRPPKRTRPLIAVVGINDATETTDYLMPVGILRRADIADVAMLATEPGPVQLYPALTVDADETIAAFDAKHPEGADYVIVPAMSRDDDPSVSKWLREQSAKGAIVIGVCAGAKVVAASGLLDGKQFTTHWYYMGELRKLSPTARYVRNRRFVIDRGVVTTTGISASMPMMLTLIEAIAGSAKATETAQALGLPLWDARHKSDAFRMTRPFALTVMANRLAFWRRDDFGMDLVRGVDEVALALKADAWSRTYRSQVFTYAATAQPVVSRAGIRILPDRDADSVIPKNLIGEQSGAPAAQALDDTLEAIARRYGAPTADVVAMQLEYQRP